MARPERNSVDYFPFLCEEGNKMFYLEETYGNDGFATFVTPFAGQLTSSVKATVVVLRVVVDRVVLAVVGVCVGGLTLRQW